MTDLVAHLARHVPQVALAVQQGHDGPKGAVQACQRVPQGDVGPHGGLSRLPIDVPATGQALSDSYIVAE